MAAEGVTMIGQGYFTIPNGLSISRLALLPLLYVFALRGMPIAFVVSYAVLGATDYFDGLAARRLNQRTEFGKALDSIVDIPFYLSSAYFMARLYPQYLRPNLVPLYVFFGIFALSFVVSAIRCGKPIMMHTFLLKLNGALVYLLVILSTFLNTTIFITVILAIYYLGFTEEILIFLLHGEVDPDTPTIFRLRARKG
jgi:CDP-diacylglycerol--glycerol-3-phosphate 3-phosphatidyltransferase